MPAAKYQDWITEDGLLQITGWARDGLTHEQIAARIGIRATTLSEWKKKYPEIAEALKKGGAVVDVEVENTLLRRALGLCEVREEVKRRNESGQLVVVKVVTKTLPPDVTAQIFWLKNRKPEQWRDKPRTEASEKVLEALDKVLEQIDGAF